MIPIEASETMSFTPESLRELDTPPKFILRSPDDRYIRRFDLLCGEMNLEQFSVKAMNAERRVAIGKLYGDQSQQYLERFNTIVASVDQNIEISEDDAAWVNLLQDQLFDQWPPLARMKAKNREYFNWAPEACITTMVIGWTGLQAEFKKDGQYLSPKSLTKAANEMVEIERANRKPDDDEQFDMSYIQLWLGCQNQMNLTGDEEKNSHAPSQPSLNQDASTEISAAAGQSTEEVGADKSITTNLALTPIPPKEAKA